MDDVRGLSTTGYRGFNFGPGGLDRNGPRYGSFGGHDGRHGDRDHHGVNVDVNVGTGGYYFGGRYYDGHHRYDHCDRPRYSFCFGLNYGWVSPYYAPVYCPPVVAVPSYGFWGFSTVVAEPVYVASPVYAEPAPLVYAYPEPAPVAVVAEGVGPIEEAPVQVVEPAPQGYAEPAPATEVYAAPPDTGSYAPPATTVAPNTAGEGVAVAQPAPTDVYVVTPRPQVAAPPTAIGTAPVPSPSVPSETLPQVAPEETMPVVPSSVPAETEAPSTAAPQGADEAVAPPPGMVGITEAFVQHMNAGADAFYKADYPTARQHFIKAMLELPDNIDAKLAMAFTEFALGSYDMAATVIRQVIPAHPEIVHASFDLWERYEKKELLPQQIHALEQYIKDHPRSADARNLLGFIEYFTGAREAALETFRKVQYLDNTDRVAKAFLNPPPPPAQMAPPAPQPADGVTAPTTQPSRATTTTVARPTNAAAAPAPATTPTTRPGEGS